MVIVGKLENCETKKVLTLATQLYSISNLNYKICNYTFLLAKLNTYNLTVCKKVYVGWNVPDVLPYPDRTWFLQSLFWHWSSKPPAKNSEECFFFLNK